MERIHCFCSNWLVYYEYESSYRRNCRICNRLLYEQRIQGLNTFLFEVERGNFPSDVSFTADDEFHEVERKVIGLARRLEEQAGLFQKVTNERAHWNEEMRQEAISQERHRLARELHDSVSQQLFAMSMMMSAINEQVAEIPDTTKNSCSLLKIWL